MSETTSNQSENRPFPPPREGALTEPVDQEIQRLTLELDASRKRVDELARAYQASERDREAFKQRLQREREQMLDLEKGKVALALLEAIDDLDLSLSASDDSPLARGVRLIRQSLLKRAEATGIERVELEGRLYDPAYAEATAMEVTPVQEDDGKVLEVVKACYQLKGRVLRPGLVKVAKYVQAARA
jgi:molecular chaperone GrpE